MEKEPCTKFCGVLISFHKVMKLRRFEFDVNDIIPVDVQNIPLLVFFAHFSWFYGKIKFYSLEFLIIFHEFMKPQDFEWLNCLDISDVMHANEHT